MRIFFALFLLFVFTVAKSQSVTSISETHITRIEKILSADSMEGRRIYSEGIEKAASFITGEFKSAGLKFFPGNISFKQSFIGDKRVANDASATINGHEQELQTLTNLIGILPGKSRPDEYVIFSAHYDHLGIRRTDFTGDSVYNGANDDASGTTAVIELANYFSRLNNNQRTIIFVAFTAEEAGDFGSEYFAKNIDTKKIIAMLNIEMIGTESKWGLNSAYITGYGKSNLGEILEKNLQGCPVRFYSDPYPTQELFLRSDNASLAKLGVPAHTISTSKMDSEVYYHQTGDEFGTLDMGNMTEIIRAIALSMKSILSGEDTPTRIKMD
jgi:Peptidase family M28